MSKLIKNLPTANIPSYKAQNTPCWIRLEAFLSTKTPNTQVTYKGILREWCKFLGAEVGTNEAEKRLLSATDLHALAYRKWLGNQLGQKSRFHTSTHNKATKSLSHTFNKNIKNSKKTGLENTQTNATIWKKFAALRRLYRVLISYELCKSNPFDTDRVPPPAKDSGKKRPTEMIPFELVRDILLLPDESTEKGLRDKAILSTLFGCGLRRSEISEIRIGDIKKSQQGTIYIYLRATKAKKDAEQALPEWNASVILKLVELRLNIHKAKDGDYLFICYTGQGGRTATNQPISHSGIYNLFKNYCLQAGVAAHVSPHSARATSITKLLEDGLSHRFVQEFSRHSSIQMVEVYDKRRIRIDQNPGKKLKF